MPYEQATTATSTCLKLRHDRYRPSARPYDIGYRLAYLKLRRDYECEGLQCNRSQWDLRQEFVAVSHPCSL